MHPANDILNKSFRRPSTYPWLMKCLVFTAVVGLAISYSKLYLFHVVLASVMCVAACERTHGSPLDGLRMWSKYHFMPVFMVIWFAISLAWCPNRWYGLQYLAYVTIGGSLVLLLAKYIHDRPGRLAWLVQAAAVAFLIDMTCGALEVLTPFRLPVSPFSVSNENSTLHEFSIDAYNLVTSMPTGFHWNPNNYSVVMCILLPFFLFQRSLTISLTGALTILWLILAAGSRGCLVASAGMLAISPFFQTRRWLTAASATILIIVPLLGLVGALDYLSRGRNEHAAAVVETLEALKRYTGMEESESESSVGARLQLIGNAMQAFGDTYGLGVGAGGDHVVQNRSYVGKRLLTSTHNFWIELLVNGGVILFVPFVLWYGCMAWELRGHGRNKSFDPGHRYYCNSLSLALVGLVPAAISASSAIYILPVYLLYGFAIGAVNISRARKATMAMSLGDVEDEATSDPPPTMRLRAA